MRPRRIHLVPPVSYQGGKRRQAPEIVRHMGISCDTPFYDLCCGSGAVSMELISRGHDPRKITMVDAGPWGDVWRLVGAGEFEISKMQAWADRVPSDVEGMMRWFPDVRAEFTPDSADGPYLFLVLQAANFGGSPVGKHAGAWTGAASHAAKVRRGDVQSLLHHAVARMRSIIPRAKGLRGICGCIGQVDIPPHSVVYLDPPYADTEGYRSPSQVVGERVWRTVLSHAGPVYVSESRPLGDKWRKVERRNPSSVNGNARSLGCEYLSLFNADWPTPEVEKYENAELFT